MSVDTPPPLTVVTRTPDRSVPPTPSPSRLLVQAPTRRSRSALRLRRKPQARRQSTWRFGLGPLPWLKKISQLVVLLAQASDEVEGLGGGDCSCGGDIGRPQFVDEVDRRPVVRRHVFD